MAETPIVLLQQRNFRQKINVTFEFARRHFGALSVSLLLIVGPFSLLGGIVEGLFQHNRLESQTTPGLLGTIRQLLTLEYLQVFLVQTIVSFLVGVVVGAYMILYERRQSEEPISVGQVWGYISSRLTTVMIGELMITLVTLLPFLLLIVPGIYVYITLSFFTMSVMREGYSIKEACQYSRHLVKGNWWSTFGLMVVMLVLTLFLNFIVGLPQIMVTVLTKLGVIAGEEVLRTLQIVTSISSSLGDILMGALTSIAWVFQYYHLVETREGLGLREEIATLGRGEIALAPEEF